MRPLSCLLFFTLIACDEDAATPDAAVSLDSGVDARTPDAGATDAGSDAHIADAATDAMVADAGAADAGPDAQDAGASDAGPDAPTYVCTQIQGAAQSRSWFIDDLFFDYVPPGTWQRLGGTGINHWRNPMGGVWDENLDHPCDNASEAPDRVVQVIWGHTTFDTDAWERNLRQAMDVTRDKYPSVEAIVLQPVASRPGCDGSYATEQHDRIVEAISRVVGDGVEAGPLVTIESCDDIDRISLDTLNDEASRRVAMEYGAFFGP